MGKIGFTGALTLLLIGLKLGGVIAWSWFWILAPFWVGTALGILLLVLFVLLAPRN